MLNFWSTASQKLYAPFNSPKTRDTEFHQKVEEVKFVEKSMELIQKTLKSFSPYTHGIRQLCSEINSYFSSAYSHDSIYYPFIKDVCISHQEIEKAYDSCVETINSMVQQTAEWNTLFSESWENIKMREVAWKKYEHYDSKMEKLVKERNEKYLKKAPESTKEIDKFDRNDKKYKKAAYDFVRTSVFAYKNMQDLLDYRYDIINPVIGGFVNEEFKFFSSCADFLRKFENIQNKILALRRAFQKTAITYDPSRFVRANLLLMGINASELPDIKPKEKYNFENYQQEKTIQSKNMKNTEIENEYSHEKYKTQITKQSSLNNAAGRKSEEMTKVEKRDSSSVNPSNMTPGISNPDDKSTITPEKELVEPEPFNPYSEILLGGIPSISSTGNCQNSKMNIPSSGRMIIPEKSSRIIRMPLNQCQSPQVCQSLSPRKVNSNISQVNSVNNISPTSGNLNQTSAKQMNEQSNVNQSNQNSNK